MSSNKERAREVEKSSVHDAIVTDANVQSKPKRKRAQTRKFKSPWRTSAKRKVYFKFIFVNQIIYVLICCLVTCLPSLTFILVRARENHHVRIL